MHAKAAATVRKGQIVLFVGNLETRKGYQDLLSAAPLVLRHYPEPQQVAPAAFHPVRAYQPCRGRRDDLVSASAVPPGSSVAFCVDGVLHEVDTQAPYWFGGEKDSTPVGFFVLCEGRHSQISHFYLQTAGLTES
jgi:hypothetical protein